MSSVSKLQDSWVRYLLIWFDSFRKELWTNTRLCRLYNFRIWNQWHTKTTIYEQFHSKTCSTKHKIPSNKFGYKYVIFAALKIATNFPIRYNWFFFLIHIGYSMFAILMYVWVPSLVHCVKIIQSTNWTRSKTSNSSAYESSDSVSELAQPNIKYTIESRQRT